MRPTLLDPHQPDGSASLESESGVRPSVRQRQNDFSSLSFRFWKLCRPFRLTLDPRHEILYFMRYICSTANQDEVNADLRARFGETVTRQEIMAWRDETGIDPRWIRKGSACNIGRGLYRIPGRDGTAVAPSVPAPRMAKREKASSDSEDSRSVIPSPFDDDTYDEEPAEETPEAPKKRGRKPKVVEEDKLAGRELDAAGEIPKPVFVHAWICDARVDKKCPGRRPEFARGPDDGAPICDCGSTMSRHSWAPSKKLF